MNKEERKTLCKEEFNNCEIVKENKQLQDKLKKIEEYIKNKRVIDLDYVEKIIEGND